MRKPTCCKRDRNATQPGSDRIGWQMIDRNDVVRHIRALLCGSCLHLFRGGWFARTNVLRARVDAAQACIGSRAERARGSTRGSAGAEHIACRITMHSACSCIDVMLACIARTGDQMSRFATSTNVAPSPMPANVAEIMPGQSCFGACTMCKRQTNHLGLLIHYGCASSAVLTAESKAVRPLSTWKTAMDFGHRDCNALNPATNMHAPAHEIYQETSTS